jgi:hypothetical protein
MARDKVEKQGGRGEATVMIYYELRKNFLGVKGVLFREVKGVLF